VVEENTSTQFHNEILKHRLQCIPVHWKAKTVKDMQTFCNQHYLVLDVKNETDEKMYVTTEHFQIVNRETGEKLSTTETRVLFPPYKNYYFMDLMRLQPGRGDTIQGERIQLRADFIVHRAQENNCHNVVSKCSFHNTVDMDKAMQVWDKIETNGKKEGWTSDMVEIKKRDFMALDVDRYFKPNSFDFVVRSIGIYEEEDIVQRACRLLIQTFRQLQDDFEADAVEIYPSSTRATNASTMENSWDVILQEGIGVIGGEDDEDGERRRERIMKDGHSVGVILDYLMYVKYVEQEKTALYSGFAKFHPHNHDSVLRVALRATNDGRTMLKTYLAETCKMAVQVLEKIETIFRKNK
jgi:3-phenylpropionate/cinnamic acid dioxygenase small subunit